MTRRTSIEPLFEKRHEVTLVMPTPDSRPKAEVDEEGNEISQPSLSSVYGFLLADEGLADPNEVTVKQVNPTTVAALAEVVASEGHIELESVGFQIGDVITFIGDDEVNDPADVEQILLTSVEWGSQVSIRVQRGLPHPFNSD